MAPSSMFSKLRPGHAKRNASSLGSPAPEPVPSPSVAVTTPDNNNSHHPDYLSSPRPLDAASLASASPVSPFPPQLPPIPRVASKLERSGSSSLLSPQSAVDHGRNSPGGLRSPSLYAQEQASPSFGGRTPSSATSFSSQTQSLAQVVEYAAHSDAHSQTSLVPSPSEKPTSAPRPSAPVATPAPPTKSKSRLSIRNPMSILMRRRSGQILDPLADESLVTIRSPNNIPPVPDNYDPSIRGRIVHDFSAPRPNRNFSYNNAYSDEQQQQRADPSPPKIERSHTPVFREHFDDETSYEQTQANIRAEQLANNDFLKRNSYVPPPAPARTPPLPPPAPKASPAVSSPPPQYAVPSPPPPEQVLDFSSSVLSPVEEMPDPSTPTSPRSATSPRTRKSAKTPPSSRSRATSMNDPSFTAAALPTHQTSRASRFSFQMGGADSAAQEKVLEDRHKEKEAEKASKQVRVSTLSMDEEYDDEYGMDDMDMDGGYEEEIPMLGEEEEYAGLGDQTMSPGMAAFDFSTLSIQPNAINAMSPMSMMGGTQTPRDSNGHPIGFAMSGDVFGKAQFQNQQQAMQGLGLMSIPPPPTDPVRFTPAETPDETEITAKKELALNADLDDDLYFDDGMIAEQDNADAVEFNEDVFDDPNGPLFDRNVRHPSVARVSQPMEQSSSETGYDADDDTLSRHLEKSEPTLAHQTSVAARPQGGPTFGNLEAYHSALADAANRAEADGRFTRKNSVDAGQSSLGDDDSSISNSRPSLVPDDGRFSQETTGFPPDDDVYGMESGFMDDYDYSDYDSALEDDPMIAAANAEALANDYEDFYGSEFGFYASQGEQPNAFGGVFGPSRTMSGRNIVREPSLTPITERSEYSTRNSFISIRGSQQLTSPGLAQLARLSPYGWPREDEDMSLDSLLKVRKATFGGSTTGSMDGSPRTSSPMGMQFLPRSSPPTGNRMREQGGSAIESDQSDVNAANGVSSSDHSDNSLDDMDEYGRDMDEDRPDSPTLTANDYNTTVSPLAHLPLSPPPSMPLYSPPGVPVHLPTGFPLSLPLPLPSPNMMQPLKSPSTIPLPTSPPPKTQLPPLTTATMPSSTTSSSAPRRASLGLVSPSSTTSPVTPGGHTGLGGPPGTPGWKVPSQGQHSRKGSAADRDSVTYVREHDADGEERWVLERRRTAESGELELVGRSIVEGGRI